MVDGYSQRPRGRVPTEADADATKRGRGLTALSIVYSVALILVAVGLYFYVVLPLWIVFAYLAYRWGAGRESRRRWQVLAASVAIWAIALAPLFFFVTVFGVVIIVAQTLAIVFGTLVLYESTPHGIDESRAGRARQVGLVGGTTSAAVLFLWGLLNVARLDEVLKIPLFVGGVPTLYLVLTVTTMSATVGAIGFLLVANRTRSKA